MSTPVSYVKIFNQVVDEFFKELIDIFPEEPKIKVQYNLFQTLSATNIKKVCNDFMIGSIPYLEKICMKDEDFFKGKERPSFLNSIGFENVWTDSLSINTKMAIWNYIKSFFTIGLKVIAMPEDSIPLIQYIINN
jgi:hypothetical protein